MQQLQPNSGDLLLRCNYHHVISMSSIMRRKCPVTAGVHPPPIIDLPNTTPHPPRSQGQLLQSRITAITAESSPAASHFWLQFMELVAIGSFFGDVQDFLQGQAARVQLTAISTPMGSFQQSIIMTGTQSPSWPAHPKRMCRTKPKYGTKTNRRKRERKMDGHVNLSRLPSDLKDSDKAMATWELCVTSPAQWW